MEWYWIVLIVIGSLAVWFTLSAVFYKQFFKRFYDFTLSLLALIVLSPLLLILTIIGAIVMKGNPFFVQPRPGKIDPRTGKEKIFKMIKFRTMTNAKDKDGNLLPDSQRLTAYGRFLRASSLDEAISILAIIGSDMSIVGPRPLLVKYLDRYTPEQHHRHDVRPGLTGYAQTHGRNTVSWEDKFKMDVWYTRNISMWIDIKILLKTVVVVVKREGITSNTSETMEEFVGNELNK